MPKQEWIPQSEAVRKIKEEMDREERKNMTRREFVKKAGYAGLGASVLWLLGKKGYEFFEKSPDESKEVKEGEVQEQEEIEKEDEEIARKTIEEQLKSYDRVVLNQETKNAIYQYWYRSYSPGGKNHKGLIESLERMEPWLEQMKNAFEKELKGEFEKKEIEELKKYVYLSIPESHFKIGASSRKKAKGPFQFMEDTAKECGLTVNSIIDERLDPEKSAGACACHLKKGYGKFNHDWSLALANYNGGFAGKYDDFRTARSQRNYTDYLKWRENRLNEFISRDSYEHEVKEDDENISAIAKRYKISLEEIRNRNNLKNDRIRVGQILKLPPAISVKMEILKDSLENLNYPEKLYAALGVIEKYNLAKKYSGRPMRYESIVVPRLKESTFYCTVEKSEGLFAAARKIHAKAKKASLRFSLSIFQVQNIIQKQNNIKYPLKIPTDKKLYATFPIERPATLAILAEQRKIKLEEIVSINPSILNPRNPLPEGMKIRIPKKT